MFPIEGATMKINDVIRTKRLELGMTQEQVALRLGVSTPAVNKWERGASYPDITLIPQRQIIAKIKRSWQPNAASLSLRARKRRKLCQPL